MYKASIGLRRRPHGDGAGRPEMSNGDSKKRTTCHAEFVDVDDKIKL